MNSLPVDIVLLPSEDLAQKAASTSKYLAKEEAFFTLDTNIGPFPHASLYMTQLKIDNLDQVVELLSVIARETPVQNLVASGYFQDKGYLDPDYIRTNQIVALQMKVVDAINPIRDGLRKKDEARLLEATGVVRENLERYGYRSVGELFRPHMTLTRFTDEDRQDIDNLPPVETFSGTFTRLGLFEMGDNGTCKRKIAELDLKG